MDKDEVKVVKIVMEGGIIQDIELPPGVKVIVRDYDVEGGIGEPGEVLRDFHGDEYMETIWE